jgi:hypothetical protein
MNTYNFFCYTKFEINIKPFTIVTLNASKSNLMVLFYHTNERIPACFRHACGCTWYTILFLQKYLSNFSAVLFHVCVRLSHCALYIILDGAVTKLYSMWTKYIVSPQEKKHMFSSEG